MFSKEALAGLLAAGILLWVLLRAPETARGYLTLALVAMLLLLAGCGTTQTVTEYVDRPVRVKVRVTEPCVEAIPTAPAYETETLRPDDPIGIVARAYRIERKQRQAYTEQLRAELEGCKNNDQQENQP